MLVAATCCEGILATGDGTKEKPYLVTRTSDEYDILQYLDKQFGGQALVSDGDRNFDVMTCSDGTELWFDITDPFKKLEESLGGL